MEEVIWSLKIYSTPPEHISYGHAGQTLCSFTLDILSNLFYIETSSCLDCSQGNFLFSVYRRETWARQCPFPGLAFTNNGKPSPELPALEQGSHTSLAVTRPLSHCMFKPGVAEQLLKRQSLLHCHQGSSVFRECCFCKDDCFPRGCG